MVNTFKRLVHVLDIPGYRGFYKIRVSVNIYVLLATQLYSVYLIVVHRYTTYITDIWVTDLRCNGSLQFQLSLPTFQFSVYR